MIKALLRYDSSDRKKVVQALINNKVNIVKMYNGFNEFHPNIICMFENHDQMNNTLYALSTQTYNGVELVNYREMFDFKKWWKGEK